MVKRRGLGSRFWGIWSGRVTERSIQKLESGKDGALAAGLSRFVEQWHRLMAASHVKSVKSCLHLAAAALSIGVIGGMYWNGLAFQYLAAWESTFLSPEGVHSLFATLFSSASAISGIAVPGIDEIRSMELLTGDEGVSAAHWIHLFAITVGMVVVLPRLLLAWLAHRQSLKLAAAVDHREVSAEYIGRLLKTREGGNLVARVVPHRMELGSKERDRLRAFVHRLWGGQLWVEFGDPISYGDEEEAQFEPADYQVLVLNFSSTPEDESQGRLVKRFREQLGGTGLLLLDGAPFRERFGELGEFERRLKERGEAWTAILSRADVGFAILDSDPEKTRIAAEGVLLKPKGTRSDA